MHLTVAAASGGRSLRRAFNAIAGGATFFTFPALMLTGLPPLVANATKFAAPVPLVAVGGLGGVLGALALLWIGAGLFASAVSNLMAAATLPFAEAHYLRFWLLARSHGPAATRNALSLILLSVFPIYGGYFGAGLGQITPAALISVTVYGLKGAVAWPEAAVIMTGARQGGFGGSRYSKFLAQNLLRKLVIAFGLLLTFRYFRFGA